MTRKSPDASRSPRKTDEALPGRSSTSARTPGPRPSSTAAHRESATTSTSTTWPAASRPRPNASIRPRYGAAPGAIGTIKLTEAITWGTLDRDRSG